MKRMEERREWNNGGTGMEEKKARGKKSGEKRGCVALYIILVAGVIPAFAWAKAPAVRLALLGHQGDPSTWP